MSICVYAPNICLRSMRSNISLFLWKILIPSSAWFRGSVLCNNYWWANNRGKWSSLRHRKSNLSPHDIRRSLHAFKSTLETKVNNRLTSYIRVISQNRKGYLHAAKIVLLTNVNESSLCEAETNFIYIADYPYTKLWYNDKVFWLRIRPILLTRDAPSFWRVKWKSVGDLTRLSK